MQREKSKMKEFNFHILLCKSSTLEFLIFFPPIYLCFHFSCQKELSKTQTQSYYSMTFWFPLPLNKAMVDLAPVSLRLPSYSPPPNSFCSLSLPGSVSPWDIFIRFNFSFSSPGLLYSPFRTQLKCFFL